MYYYFTLLIFYCKYKFSLLQWAQTLPYIIKSKNIDTPEYIKKY